MKVKDIMSADVECVRPNDTVQEAAIKMEELNVGLLPVGERERVTGVVTDRDITVRGVAKGLDLRSTPVRNLMSRDIIYCYEDDDIESAVRLMQERQVRRVLALSRDQRLVGILSLGKLAVECGDPQRIGQVLQDVSEPAIAWRWTGA